MRDEAQRSRGRDARVLLPQRTRSGVARVCEQPLSRLLLRSIERSKGLFFHVDLAAHLQQRGRLARQSLRNIGDVRHVGGDVLPHLPIAARGGEHQLALLVTKRAGEPIDLVLRGERDRLILAKREKPPQARDELGHLLLAEGVGEARHAHLVAHLGERRGGDRVPHLRARRIRPNEVRKGRLQLPIAAHQRIISRIADLGRILGVVEPVMPRDVASQPRELGGGGFIRRGQAHAGQ